MKSSIKNPLFCLKNEFENEIKKQMKYANLTFPIPYGYSKYISLCAVTNTFWKKVLFLKPGYGHDYENKVKPVLTNHQLEAFLCNWIGKNVGDNRYLFAFFVPPAADDFKSESRTIV